eukprot:m.141752 g.141752  ORF g.141752 m.141752 type:complete len:733 (+) comp16136_c0_seq2:290-2488(+)
MLDDTLDGILAGNTALCPVLYEEHAIQQQLTLIGAIKDNPITASKLVRALSVVCASSDDEQTLLMVGTIVCVCQADSDCIDILLDHGLMQGVQVVLESFQRSFFNVQLANLVITLLQTVVSDCANGFERATRAMASARLCFLLGNLIRAICQSDNWDVPPLAFVIAYSFHAIPATNFRAARKLDAKLGGLIGWLISTYQAATPSSATRLLLLLTQIMSSHEYVAALVDQTSVLERISEQAQSVDQSQAATALEAMWSGSSGVPGTRRLLPYCSMLIRIVYANDLTSILVHNCIGIFGNFARYSIEGSDDDRLVLVKAGVDHVVLDLCEQDKQDNGQQLPDFARGELYSTVANLVGSIDDHPRVTLLKINRAVVEILVTELQAALENAQGGEPWEYMQPLANLAIADDNKALLCDSALFVTSGLLARENVEPKLEHYGCKLLVQLALHQDKLPLVQEHQSSLVSRFEALEAEGQLEVTRQLAAVGRFQLCVGGTATPRKVSRQEGASLTVPPDTTQGHVMLSYPWTHQAVMFRVRDMLLAQGFKVWMDVDQMSNCDNIFESMAAAVEHASVLVVCICQEYAESENCRLECQYAHSRHIPMVPVRVNKQYQPAGWLGFILSSTLWHDVDMDLRPQQIESIVKVVRRSATCKKPTSMSSIASSHTQPDTSDVPRDTTGNTSHAHVDKCSNRCPATGGQVAIASAMGSRFDRMEAQLETMAANLQRIEERQRCLLM